MRKIRYMIMAFLMVLLVGCNKDKTIGEYEVAVIETTSNKEKSLITYYDDNLEKVGTKSLDYAELGTNFYSPVYHEDEIYIVPRGVQGKHNEKKVISLNLKTGEDTDYTVNKTNIICTAVNKKYLFAGSNLNTVSYLTRTEFKGETEREIAFNNEYLSLIAASDSYVFVFLSSIDSQNMYSKINVYDSNTLQLKTSIDITEYGINQTKYYIDNNKLYFANAYDKNDQPSNKLGILNLNDFSLSEVILDFNSPDDIQLLSDDRLLISCTDVVQSNGTHIIIYQMDTGNQTSYDLKVPILNIKSIDDKLYVLSSDNNIYIFDMSDDMKFIQSKQHELTEGVYCSNLFVDSK